MSELYDVNIVVIDSVLGLCGGTKVIKPTSVRSNKSIVMALGFNGVHQVLQKCTDSATLRRPQDKDSEHPACLLAEDASWPQKTELVHLETLWTYRKFDRRKVPRGNRTIPETRKYLKELAEKYRDNGIQEPIILGVSNFGHDPTKCSGNDGQSSYDCC